MKTRSVIILLIFLAGAISVALWLANQSMMHSWPHSKVQRDLNDIQSAVNSYRTEFDQEPPVQPSSFFDVLRGNNARGLRFLSDDGAVYKAGVRCDRWGNPYQVFRGTDGWLVRSSGPNGVFDDFRIKEVDDVTANIRIPPKAEQAGGGQPATKPADKAPAEVQPPTPTSKDAPR